MIRSSILGVLAAIVVVCALPDAALAGPLKSIGDNTNKEIMGLIKPLFGLALAGLFAWLFVKRLYPAMVVAFLVAIVPAYMIYGSPESLLQDISSSIFP